MMSEICERTKCTGCCSCLAACPQNAISMQEDGRGFKYPVISENCVDCGLCKKICPQLNKNIGQAQKIHKVWAAFSKDKNIRRQSSSGGIFSELAQSVDQMGGVIFASRMTDDQKELVFDRCEDIEQLSRFRGSKYLQSDPHDIFRCVKKELDSHRNVMFVGTGCQVAGLRSFLRKPYDNLLCVDIICHGVPSPKLWREYLCSIENKREAHATHVSFRHKKPSWTQFSMKIDFDAGNSYIRSKFDDPYLIAFLKEISLRENCYVCPYASTKRMGDITLADFWGYRSTSFKMRNNEKGISLVLINSDAGEKWFERISPRIECIEKTLKEAIGGNRSLKEPWKKNPMSEDFWNEYQKDENPEKALQEFCKPYRFPFKMKFGWFIVNHLYLVPKPILRKRGLIK